MKISLETIKEKNCSLLTYCTKILIIVPNNGEPLFKQYILIIFFPLPHLIPDPRYLPNLVLLSFSSPSPTSKTKPNRNLTKNKTRSTQKPWSPFCVSQRLLAWALPWGIDVPSDLHFPFPRRYELHIPTVKRRKLMLCLLILCTQVSLHWARALWNSLLIVVPMSLFLLFINIPCHYDIIVQLNNELQTVL